MENNSQNEETLYYAAVSRPPAERSAYLKAACGDDLELLERIASLVRIRETDENFLESPPFIEPLPMAPPLSEGRGTVIGRYRLLEKIGEGGMAVVYMAEQEEPIRRKVALKIIKLGMDTRQVIGRFEAERQALASWTIPVSLRSSTPGPRKPVGRTSSWSWSQGSRSPNTATATT